MATAGRNDDDLEQIELPKSKKKIIIILMVGILFLSGIGAGVYYLITKKPPEDSVTSAETGSVRSETAKNDTKAKPPVFLALESFTVNLKNVPDMDPQFLQIGITLEVRSDKSVDPIKQRMPQVRNKVLMLLTNSRASELSTTEGKEKLVEQIQSQINAMNPQLSNAAPVLGVFFTSFIIQ